MLLYGLWFQWTQGEKAGAGSSHTGNERTGGIGRTGRSSSHAYRDSAGGSTRGYIGSLGITAAVYDRDKTGKGHRIEASLLGSALDLQIEPIGYYLNGGTLTPRADTGLSTRIHQSPYGIYKTADKYITLSLTSFENLEQAFTPGALEGFSAKDQMDNRIEFDKVVCRELLKRTTNEWELIFEELGIWYAPVNEYEDVVKDEQVVYNQCFMTMNHPVAGEVKVLGHANRYDGQPVPLRRLPPELGENTIELLKEAGYSDSQIQEMMKQGKAVSPEKSRTNKTG